MFSESHDCPPGTALEGIRQATTLAHQRLEDRLDALNHLADPGRRAALVRRFAGLHIPAGAALAPHLAEVAGLDFAARDRARLFEARERHARHPAFPAPTSRAEALGLLYVVEGSSLGGRVILRGLAARGVADRSLAFLDPYGPQTGHLWRCFLLVLARETSTDPARTAAIDGAARGFAHAERVLCEAAA